MAKYNFNAELARDEVIEWLRKMGEHTNFSKVVLGISGGKDSSIATALCCRAFGTVNVHGILLPNGVQPDIDDSIQLCNSLGIKYDIINIKNIYDSFINTYSTSTTDESDLTIESLINLPPRIRMSMLRLWAQSNHHRLCGTGNLSEITVGYCTKDGDTSCDINPFGGLTSLEVVEVGKTLEELPLNLVEKTPTDGLSGMSDEEKLGISYIDIHKYIRNIKLDIDTWKLIHKKELAGLHKRTTTPFYEPSKLVLYGEENG